MSIKESLRALSLGALIGICVSPLVSNFVTYIIESRRLEDVEEQYGWLAAHDFARQDQRSWENSNRILKFMTKGTKLAARKQIQSEPSPKYPNCSGPYCFLDDPLEGLD